MSRLNEDPPREIWAWNVAYRGEPRKGSPSVMVTVFVPLDLSRSENIGPVANCLEGRFGWKVYRGSGWSSGWSQDYPEGLGRVTVSVRAREIRAALAELASAA